ncbi:MAG: hypothetical protein GKR89_00845 [Candidatus Latescibacteria bacterium]|nr:hypothetical protein [Candidatus Latescibacterota bacterium]
MTEQAQQVFEQGYTVLEAVYSPTECVQIERILLESWERDGNRSMGGVFGCIFHPALKYAPELAPFYGREEIVKVMREVLDDEVCLAHSGALLANQARQFCGWHCHLNRDQADKPYDKPAGYGRRVERLLGNVYLHGSNEKVGQLLVWKRRVTEDWDLPRPDRQAEWEGQTVVECPPGSIVIFDTALWHAARPPQEPCLRIIWGGHYTGKTCTVPHREDNWFDGAELEPYRQSNAVFASLTELPPAKFRDVEGR